MVAHHEPRPQRPTRDAMVTHARDIVAALWPEVPPYARCLHHASAILMIAREHGTRLVLQAGSMRWRRLPREEDDGVAPDHFSYEWDNKMCGWARWYVAAHGHMPEIHVWAGDPETQELVDLSTGTLPDACANIADLEWRTARPPDYLWCHVSKLPDDSQYEVNQEATLFANWAANRMWEDVQRCR